METEYWDESILEQSVYFTPNHSITSTNSSEKIELCATQHDERANAVQELDQREDDRFGFYRIIGRGIRNSLGGVFKNLFVVTRMSNSDCHENAGNSTRFSN
jgi:hypothetical protein